MECQTLQTITQTQKTTTYGNKLASLLFAFCRMYENIKSKMFPCHLFVNHSVHDPTHLQSPKTNHECYLFGKQYLNSMLPLPGIVTYVASRMHLQYFGKSSSSIAAGLGSHYLTGSYHRKKNEDHWLTASTELLTHTDHSSLVHLHVQCVCSQSTRACVAITCLERSLHNQCGAVQAMRSNSSTFPKHY